MNLFYRFVVFVITVIFMFCSLLMGLYSFGLGQEKLLSGVVLSLYNNWQAGILFIIAFLAGAWVIYPIFNLGRERETTLISAGELGNVNITLDALDKLVRKVAAQQEGVTRVSTKLKTLENELHIFLNVKVKPDRPLPQLTKDLQNIVKSYIEDTTGVNINEVKVLVDSIGDETKTEED